MPNEYKYGRVVTPKQRASLCMDSFTRGKGQVLDRFHPGDIPFWLVLVGYMAILCTSGVIFGWPALLDILLGEDFGSPRACAVSASIVCILGSMLCFHGHMEAGFLCMGLSGPGIQISCFHVYQHYPQYKGTLLQVATSCFDASSVVFGLALLFYKMDVVSGLNFFALYAAFPVVFLVLAVLFWSPHKPYLSTYRKGPYSDLPNSKKISSWPFIYLCILSTVHSFRINFALGTAMDQMRVLSGDEAYSLSMNEVLSAISPCGFIIVPLAGWLLDTDGPVPVFWLLNIIGIVYGIGFFYLDNRWIAYFSFVLISVSRQLAFGSSFFCIDKWFGNASFGVLAAVKKSCVAVVGISLQWAITEAVLKSKAHSYEYANVISLLTLLPCFLFLLLPSELSTPSTTTKE